jgi:hypothetical protein
MSVKNCILTEATINEYLGREIKNWENNKLNPEQIYKVYRPIEEIQKALNQYNGLDLVDEHHSINGEKTNRHLTIGHSGESAKIEDNKLYNTIFITDKEAIKEINLATKTHDQIGKRKLSCSYDYTPIYEKGVFMGKNYDVRIVDLVLDHVALVKEGRVTSAKINDSNNTVKGNIMKDFVKNALKGIFGLETINDSQIEQVMLLADKASDNVDYEGKPKEDDKSKNEETKKAEKEALDKKAKDEEEQAKKDKDLKDEEEKEKKDKAEMEKSISDAVNREIKSRMNLHINCAKALNISRLSDSAIQQDKDTLITDTLTKCGVNVKDKSFNDKMIMLETLVSANIGATAKKTNINDSRTINKNAMYTASDFK